MTLDQIIIAAALWCSPEAFKRDLGLINTCRKDLVACVETVPTDKDKFKNIKNCFLKKKL